MADFGDTAAEEIALHLTRIICQIEGKYKHFSDEWARDVERGYVLDTYAECIEAVKGKREFRT